MSVDFRTDIYSAAALAEFLLMQYPCICDAAWYERHLVDSHCIHHNLTDDVDFCFTCDCERCVAFRE